MDESIYREKYVEMQFLDKQIKQLQTQSQNLEEQIQEINYIVDSLEEVKEVKEGDEILVPISNGIFITAQVKECTNLKVNMGSNTVVDKSIKGTQDMLLNQAQEIHDIQKNLMKNLEEYTDRAMLTEAEIKKIIDQENV